MTRINRQALTDRPRAAISALWWTIAFSLLVFAIGSLSNDGPPSAGELGVMQTFPFFYLGTGDRIHPVYQYSAFAAFLLNTLMWIILSLVFAISSRRHSSPVMFIRAFVFLVAFHALTHGILTVFDLALIPDRMKM